MHGETSSAVDVLLRWQAAGSVWRVIGGGTGSLTIGLYRCDGGEEVDRLVSTDDRLVEWLGDRRSSEDPLVSDEDDPSRDGSSSLRDRDQEGRARQARPRDALGRPLPYGSSGVQPFDDRPMSPPEAVRTAREYLIAGRPFAAHEVLEGQWKAGPADERALWQGLAQLCVAVTHAQRGNLAGARTVLVRATENLRSCTRGTPPPYGLDVAGIVGWIDAEHAGDDVSWLQSLRL